MRNFYVYILSNRSRTIYIGMPNDLRRRIYEHKHKLVPGFTSRYNLTGLVYYENSTDVRAVIEREKQIRGWKRWKKIELIELDNPSWDDLSLDLFDD